MRFPEALLNGPEDELEVHFYRWLATDAGPDDWHRFALGANWGMHDPQVFEWVGAQPECDKATALTLFWLAQPDFYVEHPDAKAEQRRLVELVRERWLEGGYHRAELAFDPKIDAYLPDFDRLRMKVGGLVDDALPSSMRQPLPGRRLEDQGNVEGIPARFWPEALW